mmetsp:Transcript_19293/g.39039  ORF Transcript_19293/g.39039 Transcript_19293/m.39039 type:complete len:92 (-) Transcript_19293:522-797(-)
MGAEEEARAAVPKSVKIIPTASAFWKAHENSNRSPSILGGYPSHGFTGRKMELEATKLAGACGISAGSCRGVQIGQMPVQQSECLLGSFPC